LCLHRKRVEAQTLPQALGRGWNPDRNSQSPVSWTEKSHRLNPRVQSQTSENLSSENLSSSNWPGIAGNFVCCLPYTARKPDRCEMIPERAFAGNPLRPTIDRTPKTANCESDPAGLTIVPSVAANCNELTR
jgi:hypothetical protein